MSRIEGQRPVIGLAAYSCLDRECRVFAVARWAGVLAIPTDGSNDIWRFVAVLFGDHSVQLHFSHTLRVVSHMRIGAKLIRTYLGCKSYRTLTS